MTFASCPYSRSILVLGYALLLGMCGTSQAKSADDVKPALKFTAVDLTRQLEADTDYKWRVQLDDKVIEVEGVVVEASGRLLNEDAWVVRLAGSNTKLGGKTTVSMRFEAGTPDLVKARTIDIGDKLTVQGRFKSTTGTSVAINEPKLVKTSPAKLVERTPVRIATAEIFVREAVANPKLTMTKYKGK